MVSYGSVEVCKLLESRHREQDTRTDNCLLWAFVKFYTCISCIFQEQIVFDLTFVDLNFAIIVPDEFDFYFYSFFQVSQFLFGILFQNLLIIFNSTRM